MKKILVVDDEELIREFLAYELEYAGFEIITAKSGNEAIKILKNTTVDAILSDFKMPDGNGNVVLNFAKLLNNKPKFFFISADLTFIQERTPDQFVEQVFSKPFNVKDIIEALAKALR